MTDTRWKGDGPRFEDNGLFLGELASHFLVGCPQCQNCALVRPIGDRYPSKARVTCGACGLAQEQAFRFADWHGPVVVTIGQKCDRCGTWLRRPPKILDQSPPKHHSKMNCPGCQTSNVVEWTIHPLSQGRPVDCYFGHPLWLQTPCCGETLWAYNQPHLEFLKAYVRATLRHRQPNHNQSLASRLPRWIKLAKHRDEVLRALVRMEVLMPPKV